jgi:hypothetical protein
MLRKIVSFDTKRRENLEKKSEVEGNPTTRLILVSRPAQALASRTTVLIVAENGYFWPKIPRYSRKMPKIEQHGPTP